MLTNEGVKPAHKAPFVSTSPFTFASPSLMSEGESTLKAL